MMKSNGGMRILQKGLARAGFEHNPLGVQPVVQIWTNREALFTVLWMSLYV